MPNPKLWPIWYREDGVTFTSARSQRIGDPTYEVKAWTWRQAWWLAHNSQFTSARTDGLGIVRGSALTGGAV